MRLKLGKHEAVIYQARLWSSDQEWVKCEWGGAELLEEVRVGSLGHFQSSVFFVENLEACGHPLW